MKIWYTCIYHSFAIMTGITMNLLKLLFGPPIPSLTAEEAQDRLTGSKPPLLIDVRQPNEYKTGHIKQAKLIPLDQLNNRMHELPQGREIICVCRSGARSGSAVRRLEKAGYKATNLKGGMMSWKRAGLPVK